MSDIQNYVVQSDRRYMGGDFGFTVTGPRAHLLGDGFLAADHETAQGYADMLNGL